MIGAIAVGTPYVTTSARSVVNTRKLKVIDMKQTVEEAALQELMSSYAIVVEGELVYQRQAMLNMFRKGAEWQKEKAIEALSSVLDNWVHGGDADCIIAEFEEKLK